MNIEELEKQLAKVCQEIYSQSMNGKFITPLPPKIIVRVLPKEHRTESGLFLPGNVQNKPVYEGIVIQTYNPYVEERFAQDEFGNDKSYEIAHRCELKVGDRVAFPHFEGQPLDAYLDEKYYRTINDNVVLGILHYQGDLKVIEPLKKLMAKFSSITTSGVTPGPGVPHWEPPASSSWFTS